MMHRIEEQVVGLSLESKYSIYMSYRTLYVSSLSLCEFSDCTIYGTRERFSLTIYSRAQNFIRIGALVEASFLIPLSFSSSFFFSSSSSLLFAFFFFSLSFPSFQLNLPVAQRHRSAYTVFTE